MKVFISVVSIGTTTKHYSLLIVGCFLVASGTHDVCMEGLGEGGDLRRNAFIWSTFPHFLSSQDDILAPL